MKNNTPIENPATAFISSAQAAQAKPEKARPVSATTQGKAGMKLPRINMAFSQENYDHIGIMGRVYGCSASEYVNRLIEADREANADIAKKAKKLFKEIAGE